MAMSVMRKVVDAYANDADVFVAGGEGEGEVDREGDGVFANDDGDGVHGF